IEYIGEYIVLKDGKEVARTHATTFDASVPGEYQVIGVAGDGTEGFASEPRSTRKQQIVEVDAKGKDIDKTTTLTVPVTITEPGEYFVSVKYANGNGPVNTENKCAIRTLTVDGQKEGLVVMPQRGSNNWADLGWSNSIPVKLSAGQHTLTLTFTPDNENMNIQTNHAKVYAIRLVKD
ncbi:MAG: hypothetical protein K2H72_03990, partial [Muribaculaceae bacterium]|nr:hypothetical protein [Muribaculaceae bacterium]